MAKTRERNLRTLLSVEGGLRENFRAYTELSERAPSKSEEVGHAASPLPSPLATSLIANRVDGLSCPRTTEVMRPVILRNRLENLASILAPRSTYPV